MSVLRLENHLLRSSMTLLVWTSGLASAFLVGLTLYLARLDQTPESTRENLRLAAVDAPAIVDLLVDANVKQRSVVMKFMSDPNDHQLDFGLFLINWVPEQIRVLHEQDLVQWIESGQRYSATGERLGPAPSHWLATLEQNQVSAIISEPPNSIALTKTLSALGVETLMIRIDANRGIATMAPTRIFSETQLWGYALLGLPLLWLLLLVVLSLFALPFTYWLAKRQARRVAAPLSQLSANAERWAEGSLAVPDAPSNVLEIQQLSTRFQAMAHSWNAARQAERTAQLSLEQSIAQQRDFIADISHDLRTPLAAVMGYTERLQRKLPNETDLAVITREAQALNRLTTQLFELAQADAAVAQAPLELVQFDAWRLLVEVIAKFREVAWQQGVIVRLAQHGDALAQLPSEQIPTLVVNARIDTQRIALALSNLVDNAIRHTHAGGLVELSAQSVSPEVARSAIGPSTNQRLELIVRDNGEGIDAELLPRIFIRGVRGDAARTRRGGGLGLSIVQQIATQHGGSISVQSKPNEGACFVLSLPAG
jgi:signal transduction histidine kinase